MNACTVPQGGLFFVGGRHGVLFPVALKSAREVGEKIDSNFMNANLQVTVTNTADDSLPLLLHQFNCKHNEPFVTNHCFGDLRYMRCTS
jgi:hypothetical protein